MNNSLNKVILTDVDGVLLNWEYAFHVWLQRHNYNLRDDHHLHYDMHVRYNVERPEMKERIRQFNESAAIAFLPPLRDAIHYVRKLHEQHGFVFHVITSLSKDPAACRLRTMNLQKLFGETVFDRFVYLDTGADKDEALAEYRNTDYLWVEDKPENAEAGLKIGLDAALVEHGHNMNWNDGDRAELMKPYIPIHKNWQSLYEYACWK